MGATQIDESLQSHIRTETSDAIEATPDSVSMEVRNEKEMIEHPNEVTKGAQIGVQKAEAVALVWSKTAVYAIYAWIWICFFILALQSSVSNNMIYYAYADFASAPQISQAYIVSTIVGGVIQLPIAKTLNLWGRAEGFLLFLGVFVLGLIVIASCNGPNSFAAGYTLYWIGYNAINFILSIFVVDLSGLRNRAFVYAFIGTPSICTAFVGPLAAQSFQVTSTWRWSYGTFAIVMFFALTPLALIIKFYEWKAKKMGLLQLNSSGRTTFESIKYYLHEFDVVGGFILMAAFVLFLLPFSLEIYGYGGYSSATFISMIVIGTLLFPVFAIWERYFARITFVKYELLGNRTVLGACVLAAVIFFNFYTWDQYFYYYVQVVYNLDTSDTGYVTQTYTVGVSVWSVFFGIWIRQTKHFKHGCLFFGVPLMVLGAGLMIHFRGDKTKIGYLIMCQIFIAFSGGTLIIGNEMAVMAPAHHDDIPLLLAILGLCSSLGGAVGYAVAVAIYSNTFPQALLNALPEDALPDFANIYLGGSAAQMAYPPGSATRDAINHAWATSQKYECIAATAILGLAFPAVAMWKNYSVDKKQVKGTVI